jgi:pyruvate formate lyase activating enzyme
MDEKKALTGRIYDIQGFSVQDGPGIRTTVFLKGCPLRCPWCHSPESQEFFPQLSWMSMRCLGTAACGKCLEVCPQKAIALGRNNTNPTTGEELQMVHIDRKLCDNCGICAEHCYAHALYICGKEYTVDEVLERVSKDIPFYEHSGGGVTVSGGEALSQLPFTLALLTGLKERGIHTALDTTGLAPAKSVDAVLPYTDLFLYDLKHMDSKIHEKTVGVPNELILENARRIAKAGGKMQIRIPVIPRFNDSEENISATGVFCKELGSAVTVIQLLPYHNLGVVKYQRIDEDRKVFEAVPPSDKKMQSLKKALEDMGLPVTIH